jgi:cysteinyl-tRNA synthetase
MAFEGSYEHSGHKQNLMTRERDRQMATANSKKRCNGKSIPIHLVVLILTIACNRTTGPGEETFDGRENMREFVQAISRYAKDHAPGFLIIPQNGQELLTEDGEPEGRVDEEYLAAVDGCGREDLFYGYIADNQPTPADECAYMLTFCDLYREKSRPVLVTDYCHSHDKIDRSYALNAARQYISFAAPSRELDVIPDYPSKPFNVHAGDVTSLAQVKNLLYLINPQKFTDKRDFIDQVNNTDFDLIIMDAFFNEQVFTAAEVQQLKNKCHGGKRLIVAYISIGEAEEYRYYWQSSWRHHPPSWLGAENPQWEGNYAVHYWEQEWQKIICGTDSSYLEQLLEAGFDGAYLDKVDAFEQEMN